VRRGASITNEPHNLTLQTLSETGIVGFLLGAGAVVAAVVAAGAAIRRLRDEERAAAAALAIALPLYVLHSLVDIGWDFVAVSGPVFFAGGLVIGLGGRVREEGARERPWVAAFAVGCLLGAVYSIAAPWLAANRTNDGYAALADLRPAAAASAARDAESFNPFSVQPIFVLATAYASVGDRSEAERQFERATRLQPENPDTWLNLGLYELERCDVFPAYRALNRTYTLDPFGPAGIPGGPLDRARAYVEKRATCR